MKYKNPLGIPQLVVGNRVVGAHEEIELSIFEEREPIARHLIRIGHLVPVVREGEPTQQVSSNGRTFVEDAPAEEQVSEEKLNLTPIVQQIEQAVEGTVISDVEQVIEQEINRALHVQAVVTPTSIQVNVPIGEAEPSSEETPVEPSDKEESSTETEVGTSKPKAKKAKKASSLKDELK